MYEEQMMSPDKFWMLQQEHNLEKIDNYKLPSQLAMDWHEYISQCDDLPVVSDPSDVGRY